MPLSQIDVDFLFTLTAGIGDRNPPIRNGPKGTRAVAAVTGGSFEGPKVKGTIVPPGGDWVSVGSGGVLRLDVRLLLITDDGESILMSYQGVGAPNDDGEMVIRSAPTFETGAESYAWLNKVQAIGIGSSDGTTVTYDIYGVN